MFMPHYIKRPIICGSNYMYLYEILNHSFIYICTSIKSIGFTVSSCLIAFCKQITELRLDNILYNRSFYTTQWLVRKKKLLPLAWASWGRGYYWTQCQLQPIEQQYCGG